MEVYGRKEAPGIANDQHLLVELTAPPVSEEGKKPGLDLVAVLDVSTSMRGHKLQNLKGAMNYVIKKLGVKDRLAIIPFATAVEKHRFKLAHMSKDAKHKATSFVHGLEAHVGTNIHAALEAGLKVLHDRARKDGPLLASPMSPSTRLVSASDHGPQVLEAIATKSLGGTYHYVRDDHGATLTTSFSQPLAGLRSVVLLDLKLTLRRGESTIRKVEAGKYPQKKHADGSVTVEFGHLYRDEIRKVLMFLHLPAVHHDHEATVMRAEAVYSIPGHGKITAEPREFYMYRKGRLDGYPFGHIQRVSIEQVRHDHVSSIRKIMHAADNEELHHARTMLAGALKALKEFLEEHHSNEMAKSLVVELKQFRGHMVSQHEYNMQGRAYALASISSHERQRFTARGGVDHVRLFATPRMDKYLEQAVKFHKNPNVHI
ncbi:probable E3 ubiquitin-protein ligase WAVH2 [Lolium rigidum]|uniref:probable E3 ubiquitin-protein ligase WAVH2 n=1 Tax=Lolium rigidum TaxID=89674 RepID=UPI001F5CA1BE|nr:probable E3 ubiquitin-protein ligase WAVH2 [Lolium rigidum]